jgi:hypothetical protein
MKPCLFLVGLVLLVESASVSFRKGRARAICGSGTWVETAYRDRYERCYAQTLKDIIENDKFADRAYPDVAPTVHCSTRRVYGGYDTTCH